MHDVLLWFLLAVWLLGADGFSATPITHPSTVTVHPVGRIEGDGHPAGPLILSLPDIILADQVVSMRQLVESELQRGTLASTASYQEDIFSKCKWAEEDAVLTSIVQPLMGDDFMPAEYAISLEDGGDPDAALQAFVYTVTKHQDRLSEDQIIRGANIIQRRHAIDRWQSEEGERLMGLSLDTIGKTEDGRIDWDAISLGTRYELPAALRNELEGLIPSLLRGSWTTTDATLVIYHEYDLQVPHIDPCDATLLICLQSCTKGGDTCFPLLDPPLRLENKDGSGVLFFSSNKIAGGDGRDTLSLHHGGRVEGEKVVVQLMLEWNGDVVDHNDGAVPGSWLDVLVATP